MPHAPASRAAHSPDPAASPAQAGGHATRFDVTPEELDVLVRVGELLRTIRFGNVVIVVQDGRVVQIETSEKFRLR